MASAMNLVAESALTPTVSEGRIRYVVNNVEALSKEVGVQYKSPVMDAVGGKWGISVYVGGEKEEYADSVSVYLHWKGKLDDKPKEVCYLLRAVNQSDATQSWTGGGPQHKWEPAGNSTGHGWGNLMRTAILLDPTKGFLVDGRVIFEAEITKSTGTSSSRVDEMQEAPVTMCRDIKALLEVCQ
jgi:hypothetical protein